MPIDQLYQAAILEHNRHPHGRGRLDRATHSARGHDALCGDDIRVEARLENNRIAQTGFTGDACAVTMAAASMLMDWAPGRTPVEVRDVYTRFRQMLSDPESPPDSSLEDFSVLQPVGHFKSRIRNALLPWRTLLAALDNEGEVDNIARTARSPLLQKGDARAASRQGLLAFGKPPSSGNLR